MSTQGRNGGWGGEKTGATLSRSWPWSRSRIRAFIHLRHDILKIRARRCSARERTLSDTGCQSFPQTRNYM